jgi:hypothetical protein
LQGKNQDSRDKNQEKRKKKPDAKIFKKAKIGQSIFDQL